MTPPPFNLQLLARVMAQPWAVRRDHLALLTQLVIHGDRSARAEVPKPAKPRTGLIPLNWESAMAHADGTLPTIPDGVTAILVWGILGRAWTAIDKFWLDAIDVDDLLAVIAATPPDSTVVLWFRSPGGITTGIPETAAAFRSLGKSRRLLAFTDDMCCSAAYWLASQCERIDATPTAELGCIGVYLALYDFCDYLEKSGIKLELFKAGSMKAMGLLGNALSDEERAFLQAGVDSAYRQFKKDVTAIRAIEEPAMQGQWLSGKPALAANLANDNEWQSAAEYFAALGKGKI